MSNKDNWIKVMWAGKVLPKIGIEQLTSNALGQKLLVRTQEKLVILLTQGKLSPQERSIVGRVLAALSTPRDFDELIKVPAGFFLMGDDAHDAEKPQHKIVLPSFKIGKYPVTNAQYLQFIKATGRLWQSEEGWRLCHTTSPARYVSWHDAIAYCEWLTLVWRKEDKINENEKIQLPTEAEWEKAARGTDGRLYPWGNKWDRTKCNMKELGLGTTTPAGIFPGGISPWGCLDMAGNVWEWTLDLWGDNPDKPNFSYPYKIKDEREVMKADSKILRILRGGAFNRPRNYARCSSRGRNHPDCAWYGNGFRIVVHSK